MNQMELLSTLPSSANSIPSEAIGKFVSPDGFSWLLRGKMAAKIGIQDVNFTYNTEIIE
jgi:hypothetical protein